MVTGGPGVRGRTASDLRRSRWTSGSQHFTWQSWASRSGIGAQAVSASWRV